MPQSVVEMVPRVIRKSVKIECVLGKRVKVMCKLSPESSRSR